MSKIEAVREYIEVIPRDHLVHLLLTDETHDDYEYKITLSIGGVLDLVDQLLSAAENAAPLYADRQSGIPPALKDKAFSEFLRATSPVSFFEIPKLSDDDVRALVDSIGAGDFDGEDDTEPGAGDDDAS